MIRVALVALGLALLLPPAASAGAAEFLWRLPQPVEHLAVLPGGGDAPLLAASAGQALFLAAPDGEARRALLPFVPEALEAGNLRGSPAVFCAGEGRLAALPAAGGDVALPDLPSGMTWRTADLNGDGRTDIWGTDGRRIIAAVQDEAGRFIAMSLDLPPPMPPKAERREVWRVSAARAAEAVQARSETSFRVWTDDLDNDGAAELAALDEQGRGVRVFKAEKEGLRLFFAVDLAPLGREGDAFLLDLDGDGQAEAARLRLLAPGDEGALLPEIALEAFRLAPGGGTRALAPQPCLRLSSVFLPDAMPLVRAREGWAFVALAPRLPASAGETARLAAGGELELGVRVARFVPSPQGPAVSWAAGQGRVAVPAISDPRLSAGPYRVLDLGQPGVAFVENGRLRAVTPSGSVDIPVDKGAGVAGSAVLGGRPATLLLEGGGRSVRGVAW